MRILIFVVTMLIVGCDRLSQWQDLVEECDCPEENRTSSPPPPSPATTPDGRAA